MTTGILSTPGWQILSDACSGLTLEERVIQVLGQIVHSRSGLLWEASTDGTLFPRSRYGNPPLELPVMESSDPLIRYMVRREWIINLGDPSPELPDWLAECPDAWLLIPLLLPENRLRGLVLLTHASDVVPWNRDIIERLKASSRLAASYLALEDAGRALKIARQFETLNRLSTFVVHDLRNLLTQLSLLLGNARQHPHHKRFGEDAIITLDHVVRRMNRLIAEVRQPTDSESPAETFDLDGLIRQRVEHRALTHPCPLYPSASTPVLIRANKDRLSAALDHLLKNAQEAAGSTGCVKIQRRLITPEQVLITIEDNGPGMSETFIQTRLFTPFETTKGVSGMGIGACESREYLRRLGGDLHVESTPGLGTTVTLKIPRVGRGEHPEGLAQEALVA